MLKLNNLSIDILYNDEIDHEKEKETLIKETEKLEMELLEKVKNQTKAN